MFPFRWIYYYGSNKSTGKETGKMHLCAVVTVLTHTRDSYQWSITFVLKSFVDMTKNLHTVLVRAVKAQIVPEVF